MKILIAIPCMEYLNVEFVKSLTSLQTVGSTSIAYEAGSLIYVARERIVKRAIKEEYDYILWLDSDVVFEPDILIDLMAHKKDFVTGIYHRRRAPFSPVLFKKIRIGISEQDRVTEFYDDYPTDGLFEIDACGFGAVLHKVELAEECMKRYGTVFAPLNGYGEDIAACIRFKNLGYELFADPNVQLAHMANIPVTTDTFEQWKGIKKENGIEG